MKRSAMSLVWLLTSALATTHAYAQPATTQKLTKTPASAYAEIGERMELTWSKLVIPSMDKIHITANPRPNGVTLTMCWENNPRFPRVYQLSRHPLVNDTDKITYLLRDSDTNAWVVTNIQGHWQVFRATIDSTGNTKLDFKKPVKVSELSSVLQYFTPHRIDTHTVVSPVFEFVDFTFELK